MKQPKAAKSAGGASTSAAMASQQSNPGTTLSAGMADAHKSGRGNKAAGKAGKGQHEEENSGASAQGQQSQASGQKSENQKSGQSAGQATGQQMAGGGGAKGGN